MTDQEDGTKPAGQGRQRRRAKIYGERRTVSIRIEPELHEQMLELCDLRTISVNNYIVGLVSNDVKKQKKIKS